MKESLKVKKLNQTNNLIHLWFKKPPHWLISSSLPVTFKLKELKYWKQVIRLESLCLKLSHKYLTSKQSLKSSISCQGKLQIIITRSFKSTSVDWPWQNLTNECFNVLTVTKTHSTLLSRSWTPQSYSRCHSRCRRREPLPVTQLSPLWLCTCSSKRIIERETKTVKGGKERERGRE